MDQESINDIINTIFGGRQEVIEIEKKLLQKKSRVLFDKAFDDRVVSDDRSGRHNDNTRDDDYINALRVIDKWSLMQVENRKVYGKDKMEVHEDIARKVYRRLRHRYAQVSELEEQARMLRVNEGKKKYSEDDTVNTGPSASVRKDFESKKEKISVGVRSYRLAVTDLFVEKALAYLELEENDLKRRGRRYMRLGIMSYVIGAVIAIIILFKPFGVLAHFPSDEMANISDFTKSFSVLGMVVLLGVSLIRYGKSSIEQAQILFERRHALRQGRLFVHLHDGELGIDEMEKSFEWNVSLPNAFSKLPTEAQAPWGSVLKELVNKVPEWIKATGDAFSGKK